MCDVGGTVGGELLLGGTFAKGEEGGYVSASAASTVKALSAHKSRGEGVRGQGALGICTYGLPSGPSTTPLESFGSGFDPAWSASGCSMGPGAMLFLRKKQVQRSVRCLIESCDALKCEHVRPRRASGDVAVLFGCRLDGHSWAPSSSATLFSTPITFLLGLLPPYSRAHRMIWRAAFNQTNQPWIHLGVKDI